MGHNFDNLSNPLNVPCIEKHLQEIPADSRLSTPFPLLLTISTFYGTDLLIFTPQRNLLASKSARSMGVFMEFTLYSFVLYDNSLELFPLKS